MSSLVVGDAEVIAQSVALLVQLLMDGGRQGAGYSGKAMPHSTLTPVFTGLRLGLHALLLGLVSFAVVRAYLASSATAPFVVLSGVAFVGVYYAGARLGRRIVGSGITRGGRRLAYAWLGLLTAIWAVLVWLSPEGAYLVFPLFFLYLHVLPGRGGVGAIVVTTGFAILALGVHSGFSVGGVVGPLIGAGVAVLIGLASKALRQEAAEREALLAELVSTRQQLADTEREQGALAERARIARELHDTVAQGLSSIQMLLRAAERDTPEPGAGCVRLARETAADSLSDARQLIGALRPSRLDQGLGAALRRLGEDQARRTGIPVEVTAGDPDLPMDEQIALLRVAQGALSNVARHAHATHAWVVLRVEGDRVALMVTDNGRGFDVERAVAAPESPSFGFHAMRERVQQLDGTLSVESQPDEGTTITAELPITLSGAHA